MKTKTDEKYHPPILIAIYYKRKPAYLMLQYVPLTVPQTDFGEESPDHVALSNIPVIHPDELKDSELKRICKQRCPPIPYTYVREVPPRKRPASSCPQQRWRKETQGQTLSEKEYLRLLAQLKHQGDHEAALVMEVLWTLRYEFDAHGHIPIESILKASIHTCENGDLGTFAIAWESHYRIPCVGTTFLPPKLAKRIQRHILCHKNFLFESSSGRPRTIFWLNDKIQQAGRQIGLEQVSTSSFYFPCRDLSKRNMSKLYRQFPWLQPTRGRKRTHPPIEILNALLYWKAGRCKLRELPNNFPNWQVVHSQYVRWSKQPEWPSLISYLITHQFLPAS